MFSLRWRWLIYLCETWQQLDNHQSKRPLYFLMNLQTYEMTSSQDEGITDKLPYHIASREAVNLWCRWIEFILSPLIILFSMDPLRFEIKFYYYYYLLLLHISMKQIAQNGESEKNIDYSVIQFVKKTSGSNDFKIGGNMHREFV